MTTMLQSKKGFTLLELILTIALLGLITGTLMYLYVVTLKSWDQFGRRTDVRNKIQFALERMVRDVRQANAVNVTGNTVRFTIGSSSYIYYLYNTSELRKASLTGGIGGTYTASAGDLIASGLTNSTALTNSGTCTGASSTSCVVQVYLVGTDNNETIQVSGYVRPRNLL